MKKIRELKGNIGSAIAEKHYQKGRNYYDGNGVKKDFKEAVKYFQKAAEQGNAEAQYSLGWCYAKGEGVDNDIKQSYAWYHKAAEQGHAQSQYNVGKCYLNGNLYMKGVFIDFHQWFAWCHKAAEQGHAKAQFNVGKNYEGGHGVAQDVKEAFAWYHKAAEQGHVKSQNKLGDCYAYGEGVAQDLHQAFAWYHKAADQGHAQSQIILGRYYSKGIGVAIDPKQSFAWYQKAAELENAEAQNALGWCYAKGDGVAIDPKQSFAWYQKAAEKSDVDAQYNVGRCYNHGYIVVKDLQQANAWYQKAAGRGHAEAQYNLGVSYAYGEGVAQDVKEAFVWYQKAANQNNQNAIDALDRLLKDSEIDYQKALASKNDNDHDAAFRYFYTAGSEGHLEAKYQCGLCYHKGDGVSQNDQEAVTWWQEAAEKDHAKAQFQLGFALFHEKGIDKDVEKGIEWYQKSADQNNADAQAHLGLCYLNGDSVEKNDKHAASLFQKAANQGNRLGQYHLGFCYENGQGVEPSGKLAAQWYQRAAKQGHVQAQYKVAVCFDNGQGVDLDEAHALYWYEKAAMKNIEHAKQRANELKKKGIFATNHQLNRNTNQLNNSRSNSPLLKPPSNSNNELGDVVSDKLSIPVDSLTIEKTLGEGSFGEVSKGTWNPTSNASFPVAIKQLKKKKLPEKILEDFKAEVSVHARLSHVAIVKLYGVTTEQPYCMVMEFMSNGSLYDVINKHTQKDFKWSVRIQIAIDIGSGLEYLHTQKPKMIVHGDLKSLNVLISEGMHAKLADFGLAALKTASSSKSYAVDNGKPKGSLLWMAPELFKRGAKRTTASDMYSYGMVLWELASHELPFGDARGNTDMIERWICKGDVETFNDDITPGTPETYKSVAENCLKKEATDRIKATYVVKRLQQLNNSSDTSLANRNAYRNKSPRASKSDNNNNYMGNLYATGSHSPLNTNAPTTNRGSERRVKRPTSLKHQSGAGRGKYGKRPLPIPPKNHNDRTSGNVTDNRYMGNLYPNNQPEKTMTSDNVQPNDYLGNVYK